ncbi:hypothetical protein R1flu_004985 [Riccia fluitans]|uniref:Uncharacterized protein n=1 Tax=Riccia fluitans TaxID=41844 RepID=A0ABD1YRW1_9MARC
MQNVQPPQESIPGPFLLRILFPSRKVDCPHGSLWVYNTIRMIYKNTSYNDGKFWHSAEAKHRIPLQSSGVEKELEEVDASGKSNLEWKVYKVQKSFIFFAGLELHGIKIDWSTMNVHKGINRYSAEEKEKARKELWRMQVKFEGELCEPIDLDTKKRCRTSGSQTSNKHSRKSENTESGERAEHTEAVASGPDDKGKAKVDEWPKKPDEKNLEKQDAAQMRRARRENIEANRPGGRVLAGSEPGQNSQTGSDRGHGQGGMKSPCPPRLPMQVEEVAGHVKGFVDQMLHDFKIANQEHDGLQKRLEEA